MDYAVTTAPTTEPVSLEEAKIFLRTIGDDVSEDDAVLTPVISAAREYCENVTGRSLAPQTVTAYPSSFTTTMLLPRPPVVEVLAVRYRDESGVAKVVDPSKYVVNTFEGTITMLDIPQFKPYPANPYEIEYVTGYTKEQLPRAIRQAILMLLTHWYDNREAIAAGSRFNLVEVGLVPTLLKQYKVWWF